MVKESDKDSCIGVLIQLALEGAESGDKEKDESLKQWMKNDTHSNHVIPIKAIREEPRNKIFSNL